MTRIPESISPGAAKVNSRAVIRTAPVLAVFFLSSFSFPAYASAKPEKLVGVYFPSTCLCGRSFERIVHYMEAAGLNLAVLHVKDPTGRLAWRSGNPTANDIGASIPKDPLETAVRILKQKSIWTAAKLDVFQDSLLVTGHPELGIKDSLSGALWTDRKGLHWANPYDRRVWEYAVSLCLELVKIGVDEIQFDYTRFPTDGDLSSIEFPVVLPGVSREECIGKFLAYANSQLKPSGVLISIDVFGMTAWKTGDFGVGQVLEQIAPHVDIICPMLYPSHFPANFLECENPALYPHKIMKLSLEEMRKRTDKEIRPWIQGFWYSPEEIIAQLEGAAENNILSWAVWHPSGRYTRTFKALEIKTGTSFAEPEFYPRLEDLRNQPDLVVAGRSLIVNYTRYRAGYSILSLDDTAAGGESRYSTVIDLVSTLDESIIDRILGRREVSFSTLTSHYTKLSHISRLLVQDLGTDSRRMHPSPIYIDWDGESVFTSSVPAERLELYYGQSESIPSILPKALRQGRAVRIRIPDQSFEIQAEHVALESRGTRSSRLESSHRLSGRDVDDENGRLAGSDRKIIPG